MCLRNHAEFAIELVFLSIESRARFLGISSLNDKSFRFSVILLVLVLFIIDSPVSHECFFIQFLASLFFFHDSLTNYAATDLRLFH